MILKKGKAGGAKKKYSTSEIRTQKVEVSERTIYYGGGEAIPIKNRDFNEVENSKQAVNVIGSIAAYAGKSAASEAKALQMPKVYAKSAKVIIETAAGKKTIVATAENIPGKKFYKKYTPGTIMHAIEK